MPDRKDGGRFLLRQGDAEAEDGLVVVNLAVADVVRAVELAVSCETGTQLVGGPRAGDDALALQEKVHISSWPIVEACGVRERDAREL